MEEAMLGDYVTNDNKGEHLVRFHMDRDKFAAHLCARSAHYAAESEDLASKAEAAKGKPVSDPNVLALIAEDARAMVSMRGVGFEQVMEVVAAKVKRLRSQSESFAFFADHLEPAASIALSLDDLVAYELVDPEKTRYRAPYGLIGGGLG
jgi:hypothetical protein